MEFGFSLVCSSIFLGLGLAMDAFSVSLVSGMNEPKIKNKKITLIAGIFAFFQFLMPLIGWVCVSTIMNTFKAFEPFIPWIAFILLFFLGGKMIYESIKNDESGSMSSNMGFAGLVIQGIATSIDALSAGFAISDYSALNALFSCLIVGTVTFIVCFAGVVIGKKAGTALASKAGIFGGIILILIGTEILVTGLI